MSRITMSLTGAQALDELIENGWFTRRADGWCYYAQRPAAIEMERFIYLIKTLGAYSVGIDGQFAPIKVTRGGDSADGLLWKVA